MIRALLVAPHAGAWIEIAGGYRLAGRDTSHPTRVRGLKYKLLEKLIDLSKSHPTRVRGLKCSCGRGAA